MPKQLGGNGGIMYELYGTPIIKSDASLREFAEFVVANTTKEKEFRFKDGFFLKVKKRIKKGVQYLEIHTSGYDDTMEIKEAIEWIKWTLLDYQANGII